MSTTQSPRTKPRRSTSIKELTNRLARTASLTRRNPNSSKISVLKIPSSKSPKLTKTHTHNAHVTSSDELPASVPPTVPPHSHTQSENKTPGTHLSSATATTFLTTPTSILEGSSASSSHRTNSTATVPASRIPNGTVFPPPTAAAAISDAPSRMLPSLPFPAEWNKTHDRAICVYDAQGIDAPAAIALKLKHAFPELRHACITEGMVDKRLRCLDLNVEIDYWRVALRAGSRGSGGSGWNGGGGKLSGEGRSRDEGGGGSEGEEEDEQVRVRREAKGKGRADESWAGRASRMGEVSVVRGPQGQVGRVDSVKK